jgi:hypothetical protein
MLRKIRAAKEMKSSLSVDNVKYDIPWCDKSSASDAALPPDALQEGIDVSVVDHDFRDDLPGGIRRCTSLRCRNVNDYYG